MNSSNLVKVIAAFVAGIVVAVGSTFLYVKAHQGNTQPALVQTAPPPSDTANLPEAGRVTPPPAEPQPVAPPPKPVQETPPAPKPRKVIPRVRHSSRPEQHQDQQPVLVAQNTVAPAQAEPNPPANPYTAAPPPQPAVAPVQQAAPAAPPPAPVRQPRTMTIPSGTVIAIRLGEKLSTNDNSTGDAFRGTLESPIIMNGAVIAERGSKVLGKVVYSEKAGKVKGVSDLQLALTEINTTDGQRVQVQTAALDNQGQSGKKKDAAKVGGGAALGAIIGAIAGGGKGAGIGAGVGGAAGAGDVLFTRGKPVVLETETKLRFQLASPVTITERLDN